MKKISVYNGNIKTLLLGLFCLFSLPAFAADNALTVTVGSGLTMRTIDVGAGVQSSVVILGNSSGASILGTAGTANASILSVQGIASMTPLLTTLSGTNNITTVTTVTSLSDIKDGAGTSVMDSANHAMKVVGIGLADGSTSSGQTFSKVGCNVTTAAPTYTTAQTNPCSMTTRGGRRTDIDSVASVAVTTAGVPVINGGNGYETVAASVTAQALGATGATGDYLSHCVIYPTSTSPGVVTVFDSTSSTTNNVITFPGGTSSLSNLAPISIPVGAISLNGAWKATTGANLLLICYGKFT